MNREYEHADYGHLIFKQKLITSFTRVMRNIILQKNSCNELNPNF